MFNKEIIGLLSILLISGCANKDHVMFVTKTSLSVLDADTKPPGISIAYDRVEGYFGPTYKNGAVPPVFSSIESSGDIFNPKVKQLYATGDAALIATRQSDTVTERPLLTSSNDDKNLMFFGTSTTTGLKIGTTNNIPDSFIFGYKRKEFSYIPLGHMTNEAGQTVDVYPSVIASIDTTGELQNATDIGKSSPKLATSQFFATGAAAEKLAFSLRDAFAARAETAIGQEAHAGAIVRCYVALSPEQKLAVWNDADYKKLFHETKEDKGEILTALIDKYNKATANNSIDYPTLALADRLFASAIFISDETDESRNNNLKILIENVCFLSRQTK
jgi:hypothetical protein